MQKTVEESVKSSVGEVLLESMVGSIVDVE